MRPPGRFVYARAFFKTAVDPSRPPRDSQGLHRPGSSGELYGDQQDGMLKNSICTEMRTGPLRTTAVAAAFGEGGALLTSWLLRPEPQGAQLSQAEG